MTKRVMRGIKWAAAIAVVVAAGAGYYRYGRGPAPPRYRTQAAARGDIVQAVTANGTINPVVLVNVGTQVSGTIEKLYVDFNSRVTRGEVLARLDPRLFMAQLSQDQASEANARATLTYDDANLARQRRLFAKGFIARVDLDAAQRDDDIAHAQVALAHAQVQRDQVNLGYTVIRSPVSGVVVSRQVDVGQTVAASFQTPTLFQIAQDLKHMQIDTSVAEADVGAVRVDQAVLFYVDAYPDRQFTGTVKQVRINPTVQQNVVTYDVVVAVNNPEELLKPGMTAYANIVVARRRGVLRVANAALRFRPGPPGQPRAPGTEAPATKGVDVYVLRGNQPVPVPIVLGITDNRFTEVAGGALKPGDPVIVGTAASAAGEGGFRFRLF